MQGERAVLLTLREWKSDTCQITGLAYDVTLTVVDRTGQVVGGKGPTQVRASSVLPGGNGGLQGQVGAAPRRPRRGTALASPR